jgi:hypothetical protein
MLKGYGLFSLAARTSEKDYEKPLPLWPAGGFEPGTIGIRSRTETRLSV